MISIIFNAVGIILEIVGFVVLLFAIKSMPLKGGGYTSPVDDLPNVMSMMNARTNKIGIGLVIAGLGCQLISLACMAFPNEP